MATFLKYEVIRAYSVHTLENCFVYIRLRAPVYVFCQCENKNKIATPLDNFNPFVEYDYIQYHTYQHLF